MLLSTIYRCMHKCMYVSIYLLLSSPFFLTECIIFFKKSYWTGKCSHLILVLVLSLVELERSLKPSGSLFSHLSSAYLDKINKDPSGLKEKKLISLINRKKYHGGQANYFRKIKESVCFLYKPWFWMQETRHSLKSPIFMASMGKKSTTKSQQSFA